MFKYVDNHLKRKRDALETGVELSDEDQSSESEDSQSSENEEGDDSPDDGDEDDGAFEDDFGPVDGVLENPLRVHPVQSLFTVCIVCPGKLLKHQKMVDVHTASSSHVRRLKSFKQCYNDMRDSGRENISATSVLVRLQRNAPDLEERPRSKPKLVRKELEEKAADGPQKLSRKQRKLAKKQKREAAQLKASISSDVPPHPEVKEVVAESTAESNPTITPPPPPVPRQSLDSKASKKPQKPRARKDTGTKRSTPKSLDA